MKADLSTFALVPWEEHVASAVCDLWSEHGAPVTISPRYVVQQVLARARSMGYEPMAAAELEFRFFRETQMSLRDKDFGPNLTPLNPGFNCYAISQASADEHVLGRIARMMRDQGIEIEGYNREHGPGMYEMNIRYADAVAAGDKTMLFKTGAKEICHQLGLTVSFMAKWNADLPGCSGHLHESLWDTHHTENLFQDPARADRISCMMKHYVAGQLQLMREMAAFACPTINSYKRLVPGVWAPINATWGVDNRTTALRAITGPTSKSARVEYRLSGADTNPYLAIAATLAAGLFGIEQKLEPPAAYYESRWRSCNPI